VAVLREPALGAGLPRSKGRNAPADAPVSEHRRTAAPTREFPVRDAPYSEPMRTADTRDARDFPDGWRESAKRLEQLERFGKQVDDGVRAWGNPALEAGIPERATASKDGRRRLSGWLRSHRRGRTPAPRRAFPRARARRMRSPTRTGSSSASAGADPPPGGDNNDSEGDDDSEPPSHLHRRVDGVPWRVREASFGPWRIRAQAVRPAARKAGLP